MLKQKRKEAKMTVFDLAVKSGIHYRTIQEWERRGCGMAKAGSLKKVADALGCKVDDLIP